MIREKMNSIEVNRPEIILRSLLQPGIYLLMKAMSKDKDKKVGDAGNCTISASKKGPLESPRLHNRHTISVVLRG